MSERRRTRLAPGPLLVLVPLLVLAPVLVLVLVPTSVLRSSHRYALPSQCRRRCSVRVTDTHTGACGVCQKAPENPARVPNSRISSSSAAEAASQRLRSARNRCGGSHRRVRTAAAVVAPCLHGSGPWTDCRAQRAACWALGLRQQRAVDVAERGPGRGLGLGVVSLTGAQQNCVMSSIARGVCLAILDLALLDTIFRLA